MKTATVKKTKGRAPAKDPGAAAMARLKRAAAKGNPSARKAVAALESKPAAVAKANGAIKKLKRSVKVLKRAVNEGSRSSSSDGFTSPTRSVLHDLKIHPLAELLPPMTESEFEALKASVDKDGQIEDVMLLDGQILDGRHRHRANRELDRPTRVRDYDLSMEPVDYVYGKAVHRNLTDSQKACAAVAIAGQMERGAEQRQLAGVPVEDEGQKGESVDRAGRLFNVSGTYVQYAKLVFKQDPTLFRKVFEGGEKLTVAYREIQRRVRREVHAQKVAAVPENLPGDWWIIHEGDCVPMLDATKPAKPGFRLVVADPPYNIGVDYGEGAKADRLTPAEYATFIAGWIDACLHHMADDGSLAIIINYEWAAEHVIAAKAAGLHLRNWITWYEAFGVNCTDKFNRTSRPILHFTRHATRHVFHADVFKRASARQTEYGDKRAAEGGKVWDDVWGVNPKIPRLVDNAKERLPDFPTQLPEQLVRYIVEGFSDPGDRVLDPFSGSGTTVSVCLQTGRRACGIERSPKFAAASRDRCRIVAADVRHVKEAHAS